MECNKDEAMRAKEIAEMKFDSKDFEGAKKFALKVQNLYPGLEGLPQMLATFDVYICASRKTNGEADWYSILGINPSADDETVKKQYRKLALMLHPDKNKSIGAEGAFQLISEALSVLSDKSRRALYDHKRRSQVFSRNHPQPSQERKAQAAANGFYEFAKSNVPSGRVNKKPSPTNNSSDSSTSQNGKPDTFWTLCHICKMRYEYLRAYCNHHLLCPNCQHAFFALETPSPGAYGVKSSDFKYACKNGTSNANHSAASFRWTPFLQGNASNGAHAASFAQKTYENAVREFEAAIAAESQNKDLKRKYEASTASSTEHINFAKKRKDGEPFGIRDLSQIEICKILVDKARTVINKKISPGESNSVPSDAFPRDKVGKKAD